MTDPMDRPLMLSDALAVLEALRVEAQMHGRPHAHLIAAIAALTTDNEEPIELADYAEAELAKAIEDAETALQRVEQLRREARGFRAATDALKAADAQHR